MNAADCQNILYQDVEVSSVNRGSNNSSGGFKYNASHTECHSNSDCIESLFMILIDANSLHASSGVASGSLMFQMRDIKQILLHFCRETGDTGLNTSMI
jgi:hypothetical protein